MPTLCHLLHNNRAKGWLCVSPDCREREANADLYCNYKKDKIDRDFDTIVVGGIES